jgi:small subunit ribosomal protein S16
MVVIRLSRVGKKSHPTFRIIASDKQKDTVGSYLELLGSYDPHATPTGIELKADRIKYWLSVGAQPSDTVHNLLVEKGVIEGAKKVIAKAKKVEVEAPAPAAASAPAAETKPAE